jgi:hypothetical protein
MEYCIENIEIILEEKLKEALEEFKTKELRIIDVGVFPWHSEINLSFFFSNDTADEDDIAAWPNFNYSNIHEGGWDQAKEIATKMNGMWEKDCDAIPFFLDFGSAAISERITTIVNRFNLAKNFKIQVLDPDDSNSENYCA